VVLAWRAYTGEERKREERSRGAGHFTDGGMLRRPPMMAAGRDQGGGARVGGERCRACTSAERVRARLDHGFYRAREGEGAATAGAMAINGYGGGRRF
jgi:hypothetical protein